MHPKQQQCIDSPRTASSSPVHADQASINTEQASVALILMTAMGSFSDSICTETLEDGSLDPESMWLPLWEFISQYPKSNLLIGPSSWVFLRGGGGRHSAQCLSANLLPLPGRDFLHRRPVERASQFDKLASTLFLSAHHHAQLR